MEQNETKKAYVNGGKLDFPVVIQREYGAFSVSKKGVWEGNGYAADCSPILTKLIQEAGRWCEAHASDLLIGWKAVEEMLASRGEDSSVTVVFGMRRSGVDDAGTVYSTSLNGLFVEPYYRAVWAVDVVRIGDTAYLELYRVERMSEAGTCTETGEVRYGCEMP